MKTVKLCCLIAAAVMLWGCGKGTPEENYISAIRAGETGNWKEAAKFADRAAAAAPNHTGILIMRAIACEEIGNYDQAVDSAHRAVKLAPDNFAAQYTLGRLYSSNPLRNAEAINTLNAALKLRPDSVETMVLICNVFNRMGAVEAYNYLARLEKDPRFKNDPAFYSQLGIVLTKINRNRAAYTCFVKAFKLAGDNPDVVFNAARFFTYYSPNRNFAKQLYARFEKLASGREKYTAELDEAKAEISRR